MASSGWPQSPFDDVSLCISQWGGWIISDSNTSFQPAEVINLEQTMDSWLLILHAWNVRWALRCVTNHLYNFFNVTSPIAAHPTLKCMLYYRNNNCMLLPNVSKLIISFKAPCFLTWPNSDIPRIAYTNKRRARSAPMLNNAGNETTKANKSFRIPFAA